MYPHLFTQADDVRFGTLAVPATGGTALSILSMAITAGIILEPDQNRVISAIIQSQGLTLDFVFGGSAGSLPCTWKAYGPDFTLPAVQFAKNTFMKSSGAGFNAAAIFLLKGA